MKMVMELLMLFLFSFSGGDGCGLLGLLPWPSQHENATHEWLGLQRELLACTHTRL